MKGLGFCSTAEDEADEILHWKTFSNVGPGSYLGGGTAAPA
jgi:hypothetical protein